MNILEHILISLLQILKHKFYHYLIEKYAVDFRLSKLTGSGLCRINGRALSDAFFKRLIWFGHVKRVGDKLFSKMFMDFSNPNPTTKLEKPIKTWRKDVNRALVKIGTKGTVHL